MNASKKQRKRYRAALKRHPRDRFEDMMAAVIGGGTRSCACCRLVRPRASLDAAGVCRICTDSMGRVRVDPPAPREPHAPLADPQVVYVDASYHDGHAGLAVIGALGEHTRQAEASSSTHAEVLALRWALAIASEAGIRDLIFRTDCQAAFKMHCNAGHRYGWKVQQVPRYTNQRADALASFARQGGQR